MIVGARLAWPGPLVPARLFARVNRFAVLARLDGGRRPVLVHLPNSGRMTELLTPGAPAWVRVAGAARTTRGTLLLVQHGRRWVGVDAHVPNRVVEAALRRGGLGPIAGVRGWRREVALGDERLDFLVETAAGPWLVEAKSCNHVVDGAALFPDAPTLRGARHLRLLAHAAAAGRPAAVVWVVQRSDARLLRPHVTVDPDFATAMRQAARTGVRLLAYACGVSPRGLAVLREIPVAHD